MLKMIVVAVHWREHCCDSLYLFKFRLHASYAENGATKCAIWALYLTFSAVKSMPLVFATSFKLFKFR